MYQVLVFVKKQNIRLLGLLESGTEEEVVIARNGKPVAKMVLIEEFPVSNRLGVAKGVFECPESIDDDNELILSFFGLHE